LLLAGFPLALDLVRGWAPQAWVDAFAGLSFLTHFQAISRGVLDLRDVVFFLLCIATWLAATVLVIDLKKAD
jgi:ABC-2 type transport system permease protein